MYKILFSSSLLAQLYGERLVVGTVPYNDLFGIRGQGQGIGIIPGSGQVSILIVTTIDTIHIVGCGAAQQPTLDLLHQL